MLVFGNYSDIFILIFLPGTEPKNDATSFRGDLTLYYRVLFSRDDKTTPALFVLRYD